MKLQVFIALFLLSASVNSMPMLTYNSNGQISGATGLIYKGKSYRATLSDGTCASVFNGCDSELDFRIGNVKQSRLAKVFYQTFFTNRNNHRYVKNPLDNKPNLAVGCNVINSPNLISCFMHTPVSFPKTTGRSLLTSAVLNYRGKKEHKDRFHPDQRLFTYPLKNFSSIPGRTWLSFSESVDTTKPKVTPTTTVTTNPSTFAAVPIPGTFWLLILGLAALGLHQILKSKSNTDKR